MLKPAEQTPASIMVLMELVGDLIPPGVLNVVNGFGLEAANRWPRRRASADCVHRRNHHRAHDHAVRHREHHPVSLELGGKSPNIFFGDVMDTDDGYLDKALEGFTFFALNQGEVCTCPSRADSGKHRR